MKKILFALMTAIAVFCFAACSSDNGDDNNDNKETVVNPEAPSDNSKILVAYFSWSGSSTGGVDSWLRTINMIK